MSYNVSLVVTFIGAAGMTVTRVGEMGFLARGIFTLVGIVGFIGLLRSLKSDR